MSKKSGLKNGIEPLVYIKDSLNPVAINNNCCDDTLESYLSRILNEKTKKTQSTKSSNNKNKERKKKEEKKPDIKYPTNTDNSTKDKNYGSIGLAGNIGIFMNQINTGQGLYCDPGWCKLRAAALKAAYSEKNNQKV
jgi:hypothetical protein